ncbi:hypothetical protein SAMN00777080_1848 [Aquiflexum balticum DSM 16537]|uniref:Uncharacterized protein n=1 Tax=Aquiflexum balticum DSM 16537 TaxID=758820 RepID=A0A1W2H2V8_9BACT|nr:hypothetical protein [Aquiflexum balticum]SMD43263.1 hypothetical protein SAMN00777080_1848 [Aquiflexum balticum DSM 16537]
MVVNEVQSFRGSVLMFGILLLELPTLILVGVLWQTGKLGDDGPFVMGLVVGMMILIFWLLMAIRLELRLTTDGLSYRNPPFLNRWTKINKEEMETIQVKKMSGILEYGGVGVRFSKKTRAYIFFADYVVEVQLPKRKLVFSTHKPREMEEMILLWKENKNLNTENYG